MLKVHEVNKEEGTQKRSLDLHVQIKGESDPEVVSIREHLLGQSSPLLGDLPDLLPGLDTDHLEVHVTAAAAEGHAGALNPEHRVAKAVLDQQLGMEDAPLLRDAADDCSRGTGHLHFLEATREAAILTPERPLEMDHLLTLIASEHHVETSSGPATKTVAAF